MGAGVSLALPRFRGGKGAPQLARMGAEDLIGAVFPDQIACAENLTGEREIPDHPLVRQTIGDCLNEAMDIEGLERLLTRIESGEVRIVSRDLTEPSPLALEVLSARPYAYLDDAPLEERRTQAVMGRRWLAPEAAAELGRLDPEAIARVREEAWPDATNADELHDALMWLGFLTQEEAQARESWCDWLAALAQQRRVARLDMPGASFFIAAERLPQFRAVWPSAAVEPTVVPPTTLASQEWTQDAALLEIVRGRLEGQGPLTQATLARALGVAAAAIAAALAALEAEGFALRGRFSAGVEEDEWCERRLLARIHHYTLKRLRAEIEPVAGRDFVRFLLEWQKVAADAHMEGPEAVDKIVAQLEGFEAAAGAWETEILPARLAGYEPVWLDDRCRAGHLAWARLKPRIARSNGGNGRAAPVRSTPIALVARRNARHWNLLSGKADEASPSVRAQQVLELLGQQGASFFDEIADGTGQLRTQVEEALAELVALGQVSCDSFAGLRALLVPSSERRPFGAGHLKRRTANFGMEDAGRWTSRAAPLRAQPRRKRTPTLSSMSRAHCCSATASCSGGFWSARRIGCRRGVSCCGFIGAWRTAARSAAGVLWPASPGSSTRSLTRSGCCGRSAAGLSRAVSFPSPGPIRSTSWAFSRRGRGFLLSPATGSFTATAFPLRSLPAAKCAFSPSLRRVRNGTHARRCCAPVVRSGMSPTRRRAMRSRTIYRPCIEVESGRYQSAKNPPSVSD